MAIYEATVFGEYWGQLTVNRFHYVSDETPGSGSRAEALAEAMGLSIDQDPAVAGTVVGQWLSCVSTAFEFREFIVRDLYSNTNFFAAPFAPPITGVVEGDSASPLLAYGLSTNRVRTDIRRGQKRFAGVSEAQVGGGGLLISGMVDALETLATAMSDVLVWTEGEVTVNFTPCILGLERMEADPPDHPDVWYRLYETEAEQLAHIATGLIWTPKLQVRSQNSRQYGKGR